MIGIKCEKIPVRSIRCSNCREKYAKMVYLNGPVSILWLVESSKCPKCGFVEKSLLRKTIDKLRGKL